jgi:hypothetical protein
MNIGEERGAERPERNSQELSGEARSLVDLYDEVLDLQEELYSDMASDDIFSFNNREALDLFSALVCDISFSF